MGNKPLKITALCELFDKADTGGDGTISLEEYMVMMTSLDLDMLKMTSSLEMNRMKLA